MAGMTTAPAVPGASLLMLVVCISTLGGGVSGNENITQHGNSGTFLSPNYPSEYSNNLNLSYIAHLDTPGPQQVRLDYDMLIQHTSYCNADYVWLPDLSRKLCGGRRGSLYLSIEGDVFNISFVTDHDKMYSGFNITYTVLEGTCHANLSHTSEAPGYVLLPITDMMFRFSVVFSVRACQSILIVLAQDADFKYGYRKITIGEQMRHGYTSGFWTYTSVRSYWHGAVSSSTRPQNCCHFRPLWVSWNRTSVVVGTGADVGSNIFLQDTTSDNVTVRLFFWFARTTSKLMLNAPLPDSYCTTPHDFTLPEECYATTIKSTNTKGESDVTTPLQGGKFHMSSEATDSFSALTDATKDQHIITTSDDSIITADNDSETTDQHASTAANDSAVITENDSEATDKYVSIAAADSFITNENGLQTTDQHVTTDPDGVVFNSENEYGTTDKDVTITVYSSKVTSKNDLLTADDVISSTENDSETQYEYTNGRFDDAIPTTEDETQYEYTNGRFDDAIPTIEDETQYEYTNGGFDDAIPTIEDETQYEYTNGGFDDAIPTIEDETQYEYTNGGFDDAIPTIEDGLGTTIEDVTATADDAVSTNEHEPGTTDGDSTSVNSEAGTTLSNNVPEPMATTPRPPPPTAPPLLTHNPEQCWCKCVWQPPPVRIHYNDSLTASQARQAEEEKKKEVKAKMAKEIEAKLKVPTSNVSSNARRYVSAGDERSSSKYMAIVVGVVCFLPLAAIVLLDVISLLSAVVPGVGHLLASGYVSRLWKHPSESEQLKACA